MSKLSDRFVKVEQAPVAIKIEAFEKRGSDGVGEALKEKLLEKVNSIPVWSEFSQEKQLEMVKNFVDKNDVPQADKFEVTENLTLCITGFGPLQYLLDNENVSAIYVNGTNSVHIEINGKILNTEIKLSKAQLSFILNSVGFNNENIFNSKTDKYEITVISSEICESGTNVIIRKIKEFDEQMLIDSGMISREIFNFLIDAISQKKRIVISGGVNTGKTVLLEALIKACLLDKRTYLLEKGCNISAKSDFLVKFDVNKIDFETLLSIVLKSSPEYTIADLNLPYDNFSILTMRETSVNSVLKSLIAMYSELPEKFAKSKALTNFDYIVLLDKTDNGTNKVETVVELTPAKTMALSLIQLY